MQFHALKLQVYTRIANEKGQGLVEYALLLSLVAVIAVSAIRAFGISLGEYLTTSIVTIMGAL
ncbi:MAG: hypothetical protein H6Q65_17 [Firmicutes bacterium]|nr:hypothetical protein [Bacillota bacterium]